MSSKTPPPYTERQLLLFRYRSRLFAVSTFALLAFIGLLLVNVRNPVNPVDTAIWQFFVNIRMGWFDRIVEIFTSSFNTIPDTIYALIAVALLSWRRRDGWAFLTVALSMISAPLAMIAVKNILDRSRPPLVDRLVHETSFSFPSGHSTGIAALTVSVFLALLPLVGRRARIIAGIVLAALALTVLCSRLYVGVHWGTDVTAGACLGTAMTCMIYGIFPKALLAPNRQRS